MTTQDMNPLEPWRWPHPRPSLVIRTGRLILRPYAPTDAGALQALVTASKETLLPWLPWAREAHASRDASLAFVEACAADHEAPEPSAVTLGIFDAQGGTLFGGIGLARPKPAQHSFELGYWLGSAHVGQGICTEATRHLVSYAFSSLALHRVRVQSARANTRSTAVIERLGLRQEALFRRAWHYTELGWVDRVAFAVLAEEWDAKSHQLRDAQT